MDAMNPPVQSRCPMPFSCGLLGGGQKAQKPLSVNKRTELRLGDRGNQKAPRDYQSCCDHGIGAVASPSFLAPTSPPQSDTLKGLKSR